MYHHHHQHHSHHHQPTQLSYLPGAGLQYAYNNYCMMPPVYNSINSLVAAPTHPATSLLPTNSSGPAVMTEDARESRESVLVSSSSGGLSLPDSNLSVVEVEAGEDRTDYMEELSRERESLEQGETNHARRLIDRGELSELSRPQFSHLTSSHYRDLTAPVRAGPGPHQLRGSDGGRLQGEAHPAGGEGDSSSEGTSQGNERTFVLAKNYSYFFVLTRVS